MTEEPTAEHTEGPADEPGAPPRARTRAPRRPGIFLRGLATLLPVFLTIFVFVTVINFAKTYVVGPINDVIYWSLEANGLGWRVLGELDVDPLDAEYLALDELPPELHAVGISHGYASPAFYRAVRQTREEELGFFRDLEALFVDPEKLRDAVQEEVHPLVGLGASLLLVLWIGVLVGGFVGRRLVARVEGALGTLPGIRSVYPYSKRFVEFFFSDDQMEFETVVALPYPAEGTWSLGFVTNRSMKSLREATGEDLVTVFVPSSPMPMTGWTIQIAASRLVPIPISVDDALRISVSGGVLVPPSEYAGRVPENLGVPPSESDGEPPRRLAS